MSRGLKIGDVYKDQEGEMRRSAIIISVAADGTQARLEYLDGDGEFPATQDKLVGWTIVGSVSYRGDPSPWRITKRHVDGHLRWETFAPDKEKAGLLAQEAGRDTKAVVDLAEAESSAPPA